jgi:hypothetical protein
MVNTLDCVYRQLAAEIEAGVFPDSRQEKAVEHSWEGWRAYDNGAGRALRVAYADNYEYLWSNAAGDGRRVESVSNTLTDEEARRAWERQFLRDRSARSDTELTSSQLAVIGLGYARIWEDGVIVVANRKYAGILCDGVRFVTREEFDRLKAAQENREQDPEPSLAMLAGRRAGKSALADAARRGAVMITAVDRDAGAITVDSAHETLTQTEDGYEHRGLFGIDREPNPPRLAGARWDASMNVSYALKKGRAALFGRARVSDDYRAEMVNTVIAQQVAAGGHDTEGTRAEAERWLAYLCGCVCDGMRATTDQSRLRLVVGGIDDYGDAVRSPMGPWLRGKPLRKL